MAESLYRKYRSRTFDELVGQEHITRTLANAVNSGRIAHAYLFCGPRGTGKTSTARLLAKAVNCEAEDRRPCNECRACTSINTGRALDLVEIDAASRRKVEDIAEVIDRVSFAPAELRYKVYIIDEVHMLTTHAFNALLKTLEEPPSSAIFILATTEVWKVLPTIVSRCQRFDFRRIPADAVVSRVEAVASAEGLHVQPQALAAIARLSTGSLRDALGLLDQLAASGEAEITLDQLEQLLGAVGSGRVAEFVDSLIDRDASGGLAKLSLWNQQGIDPRQFVQELVEYLRNVMLLKLASGEQQMPDITHEALDTMKAQARRVPLRLLVSATERFSTLDYSIRTGPYGFLPVELALVAVTADQSPAQDDRRAPSSQHAAPEPRDGVAPRTAPAAAQPASSGTSAPRAPRQTADVAVPAEAEADLDGPPTLDRIMQRWPRAMDILRATNRSLHALLRSCSPTELNGSVVMLSCQYEFHKVKVEEAANRALLEQVLTRVMKAELRVVCVVAGSMPSQGSGQAEREQVLNDESVRAAINIFGAKITEINGGQA